MGGILYTIRLINVYPNELQLLLFVFFSQCSTVGRENNTPNGIALKETADEVRAEQLTREEYCYRQLSTRWRMRTRGAMSGQVHTVCRCVLATFSASLRHTARIQNIQTVKWIICLIKLLSVDVDWKSKINLLKIYSQFGIQNAWTFKPSIKTNNLLVRKILSCLRNKISKKSVE